MSTNKKWYVRKSNISKILSADWMYYRGENCWVIEIEKAKIFNTRKSATVLASDIEGEVYGE